MTRKIDNRRDILLLLLYSPGRKSAPNEPVAGGTRLTKMLFLFREEALQHFRAHVDIDEKKFYEFFPWNFGPFSREVYDDLTFFELRGFITRDPADEEETTSESAAEWQHWMTMSRPDSGDDEVSEYEEQVFRLTAKGEKFASELYATLSTEQRKLLREFKSRLVAIPLRGLLKYVYENYEDSITRSGTGRVPGWEGRRSPGLEAPEGRGRPGGGVSGSA